MAEKLGVEHLAGERGIDEVLWIRDVVDVREATLRLALDAATDAPAAVE